MLHLLMDTTGWDVIDSGLNRLYVNLGGHVMLSTLLSLTLKSVASSDSPIRLINSSYYLLQQIQIFIKRLLVFWGLSLGLIQFMWKR